VAQHFPASFQREPITPPASKARSAANSWLGLQSISICARLPDGSLWVDTENRVDLCASIQVHSHGCRI